MSVEFRLPEIGDEAVPAAPFVRQAASIVALGIGLLALVAVVAANTVSFDLTIDGRGTVEPTKVTQIRADESGNIVSVEVSAGEAVAVGRRLVNLESTGRETVVIHAPAAGVILTSNLDRLAGSYVHEGDLILEIAETAHWRANIYIPKRSISEIRPGDPVKLKVPALQPLSSEILGGHVILVANDVNTDSGFRQGLRVSIAIDTSDLNRLGAGRLRPGYFVEGKVIIGSGHPIVFARDYFSRLLEHR
jgi:multidrug resistance efflux pump